MNRKSEKNSIMVSICCFAYNHENYIRDALEGFVNQKTNFKYEVIINDDASTDKTAKIIKEYENNYPEIIKPIYQSVNQYSQHVSIFEKYIFPKINGKYIAVCEGDDYWISENKLQKQVDFMETHLEYSACTHVALLKDYSINKKYIFNPTNINYTFNIDDIILWDKKKYQTASLLAKKELFLVPNEINMKQVKDYPRAVYLALHGPIFYMKDIMSVYRVCTPGSWTANNAIDPKKIVLHMKERIDYLNRLDRYTSNEYHTAIVKAKRWCKYNILHAEGDYKALIFQYRDIFYTKKMSEQIKILGMACLPKFGNYIKKFLMLINRYRLKEFIKKLLIKFNLLYELF